MAIYYLVFLEHIMRIVIAPDSFKGCLSAEAVAENIVNGLSPIFPRAKMIVVPQADGGEGTLSVILRHRQGQTFEVQAHDPLGRQIKTEFGVLEDGTVVIETAKIIGLSLIQPHERNPLISSSYGVGELILNALEKGHRKFIIGIGGSATNDAGMGMIQALGGKFLDKQGNLLGQGGAELQKLHHLDLSELDSRLTECSFQVACDVSNPLIGENGASRIYAPQKGATNEDVELLENALTNYSQVIENHFDKSISEITGVGAAGGLGAGLLAFLKAELTNGFQLISKFIDLEGYLPNADFVITGEGKVDTQTAFGKLPFGMARLAKKHGVPCIGIAGTVEDETQTLHQSGMTAIFSIADRPLSGDDSVKNAPVLVQKTAEQIGRLIRAFR